MDRDKAPTGIYLNTSTMQVLRCSTSFSVPRGPEWVLVTPEVNATLLKIREVAREKGLASDPDKIVWGSWT